MRTAARPDGSRRDSILDAALACFLRDSVAGTTIDDIKARSGASVGSIYHHFGSKEGIAAELYLDILGAYHEAFLGHLTASSTAREGIAGSVRLHLRWVATSTDRARYLFHCREPEVITGSGSAVRDLNKAFYARATQWIERYVESGDIRPLSPEVCQALWMGPCMEFARQWLASSRRRPSALTGAAPVLGEAAWDALRHR